MSLSNTNAGFCRLRSLERLGDRLTVLNPLTTPLKVLVGPLYPQLTTVVVLCKRSIFLLCHALILPRPTQDEQNSAG